jgi:hypothetical protein
VERKITAICSTLGVGDKPKTTTHGAYYSVERGAFVETADLIRTGIEDSIRYVCAVNGYGNAADYWGMNVYEFYRDFVRAYNVEQGRKKKK